MPVWNRAGIVGRAIESVLAQTFTDYELLIVDDGSDDNLEEAVQPYLSCAQVRYFKKARAGVGAARNFALQESAGEYIAYLDSDNVWHKEYLARMYAALADGSCDSAYCRARQFRKAEDGAVIEDGCVGREFSFRDLLERNYIDLNTFVHSRRMYLLRGGFDERLRRLNDWDLIIRFAGWGEIRFVPETLVDYFLGVEENAITLTEDLQAPLQVIGQRYGSVSWPATIVHDTIAYEWASLPDRKYRNYWRSLQPDLTNTLDFKPLVQPLILQIEPTNTCNLKCPLCPVALDKLGRPPRHMSLDEFRKIVDDVADHAMLLVLWDWGEPFMNPHLADMIAYAAARDIRTVTCTNAHFLHDRERLERILLSGLDTLIVAIDSMHADTYLKYRKEGSLDKAMAGLRTVIAVKRATGSVTTINFRMVAMRQNEHEVWPMERLARSMGADVFSVKTVNPDCNEKQRDGEFVPKNPALHRLAYVPGTWERIPVKENCRRVWVMANIAADGSVVPCCYDYDGSMAVGNVLEAPFAAIWNGAAYGALRKKILTDKYALPKCAGCLINFRHTAQGMFFRSVDFRRCRGLEYHRNVLGARFRTFRKKLAGSWVRKRRKYTEKVAKLLTSAGKSSCKYSGIFPVSVPLRPDYETGWKPYPLFNGKGAAPLTLSAHISVLTKTSCPHPPHVHDEEELLVLLHGEVDLLFPDAAGLGGLQHVHLTAGQLVYYPAGFPHTLQTTSEVPANYFMLKWTGTRHARGTALAYGLYEYTAQWAAGTDETGFVPRLVFEGSTGYLGKLRCHTSSLSPGAGYEPHADPYQVVIIVLEGEVETLGKRVAPHGVIYYHGGESHGMFNPGMVVARYLVFELHC